MTINLAMVNLFSLLLFGTEFRGKGELPENIKYEYYKASIFGVKLRAWMGLLFFDVQGGRYFLS